MDLQSNVPGITIDGWKGDLFVVYLTDTNELVGAAPTFPQAQQLGRDEIDAILAGVADEAAAEMAVCGG